MRCFWFLESFRRKQLISSQEIKSQPFRPSRNKERSLSLAYNEGSVSSVSCEKSHICYLDRAIVAVKLFDD